MTRHRSTHQWKARSWAHAEPPPQVRRCEVSGCAAAGEYRAPKSREALNQYYWFCLDHVRDYNSRWNYYQGMSPEEIEAHVRRDTTWQRPSWPFSRGGATDGAAPYGPWRDPHVRDRFGMFDDEPGMGRRRGANAGAADRRGAMTPEQEAALELFDMVWPVEEAALKARYIELVKQHHPDINGGDKEAEETLKRVNQAYATLRQALAP
jgi:hypothetical protein